MYREDISQGYIRQPRRPELVQVAGIDGMRHRALPVGHLRARSLEALASVPAPLDADDRVVLPVADRHRKARGGGHVELEALDSWHEAAEGEDGGRPRPPGAQAERVGHDRALGEAAQDQALVPESVGGQEAVEPVAGE